MIRLLFNTDRRLRNGWWMLIFVGLFLLSRLVYTPSSRALTAAGMPELALEALRCGFLLLVTWICLRLRRQGLADVGLRIDARWWRQAGIGLGLGLGSVVLAAAPMLAVGAVHFAPDPARSIEALLVGFAVFTSVAVFEELLFRGFLFQRLIDGTRPWIAQLVFASLFAVSHLGNPDMDGAAAVVATIEIFFGALLLGLAYLRTRSLALPIGLHLGWNWMQGSLLGFDVSGFAQAGWWQAELASAPAWVTGAGVGLEGSVFAVLADIVMIAIIWRWRGVTGGGRAADAQPVRATGSA